MRRLLWGLAVRYLKPKPTPVDKPQVGDIIVDDMKATGMYTGTVRFDSPQKIVDATGYALAMASLWQLRCAESEGLHGLVRSNVFRYAVKFEVKFDEAPEDTDAIDADTHSLRLLVDRLADHDGWDAADTDSDVVSTARTYDFAAAKAARKLADEDQGAT